VFKVMILICALNVDHKACTPETAIDVVKGPPAHTWSQCMHESQTTLANTSIRPELGKQYMKVVCTSDQPS
jgi:hypothetical protein